MEINDVSGQVVDAAIKVHSVLGPGLLETAYKACLAYETAKSFRFTRRSLCRTSSSAITALGC